MVASKCSQDHFIFKEYKTVQPFKLHFLQNSPLVQIHTSASYCEGIRNIPGSHFVQAFSAISSHSWWCPQHQKSIVAPSVLFSVEGTGKNQLKPGQKSMGDAPVLSHYSLLRNPSPKSTGVLEHCCEGETTCWFYIFQGISFWLHP